MEKKHMFIIQDEMLEWSRRNRGLFQSMEFIRDFNEIANKSKASEISHRIVKQKLSMVQKLHFLLGTKEQLLLPYPMESPILQNYNRLVFAETGNGMSYKEKN